MYKFGIKEISKEEALKMIRKYHYSNTLPKINKYFLDNLNRAYLQVVRNKGAEGVDGMKYTELGEHLVKNGEIIKEQLRTRKYKPQPVRRVEIPKPDGGVRNLGEYQQ